MVALQQIGRAKKLATFEIPQRLYLDSEQWTPQTGLVTEAMKVRRFAVKNAFVNEIKAMYST
ncbi:unnamed protein product [Dibothriocephalus latus]|uniref:AMP-dependent synthetase/ligase domain-containing protein n=1 Tax=Dibothriocephalus latus TaxID=60516 RepID=A0A3P7N5N3_DIBLA|nr:unnamed protein product [Dibothriocephalus latus]